jgi:hypothetical protein
MPTCTRCHKSVRFPVVVVNEDTKEKMAFGRLCFMATFKAMSHSKQKRVYAAMVKERRA